MVFLTVVLLGAFAVYSMFSSLQRLQANTIGSGNAGEAIRLTISLAFGGFLVGYFSVALFDLSKLSDSVKVLLRGLKYALAATVLIATATWSFDFWGASRRAGSDLVAGRDPGSDSYVLTYLSINLSAAQIFPIGDADPLQLCDGKKLPYTLGDGGDETFVLIYSDVEGSEGASVVRVPQDLYAVATGLREATPCVMPGG